MSTQRSIESRCVYEVAARFYDLCYGATAPIAVQDVPFYLELASHLSGPVLELGCGTGRVGIELARGGHQIVGLDLSAGMLDAYRAKLDVESQAVRERVSVVQGDMASFDLGRKFALIIVPFRAFQHLLDEQSQRECLTAVREHLADGGRFVFDAFNPSVTYIANAVQKGRAWSYDVVTPDGEGGTLMRSMYANPDPGKQMHELMLRYEQLDSNGRLVGTWIEALPLRWLYRWEAQYLLELCGLEIDEAYGAYDKSPLDGNSKELIFVCKGM
ncbi:MAG: class I SAM-dependent methyltransferase [bacterium]|nr:class I SAM-dependent methyltransferase [bacterium]